MDPDRADSVAQPKSPDLNGNSNEAISYKHVLREHLETKIPDTAQPTEEEVQEYESMISK
jgi:hypothetical protein